MFAGGINTNMAGELSLTNCHFQLNAGAVYASATPTTITDCTFANNQRINGDGGAVQINGNEAAGGTAMTAAIVNSTFTENLASGRGGALAVTGYDLTVTVSQCTFDQNSAEDRR